MDDKPSNLSWAACLIFTTIPFYRMLRDRCAGLILWSVSVVYTSQRRLYQPSPSFICFWRAEYTSFGTTWQGNQKPDWRVYNWRNSASVSPDGGVRSTSFSNNIKFRPFQEGEVQVFQEIFGSWRLNGSQVPSVGPASSLRNNNKINIKDKRYSTW